MRYGHIDDGQIQHRHEVSQCEQKDRAEQRAATKIIPLAGLHRRVHREMSIVAVMDSPTRSGCWASSFGSSATRTGRRCTTLIQLPVAFWAGISAKAAPVPPERPSTCP